MSKYNKGDWRDTGDMPFPSAEETKKGFEKSLESLRNAEKGSPLHDIYKEGEEIDKTFNLRYGYLGQRDDGTIVIDSIQIQMGYNKPQKSYILGFAIPKTLHISIAQVVEKLFNIFLLDSPIIGFPVGKYDIYFIPLVPIVADSFETCIVELVQYIKSLINMNNTRLSEKIMYFKEEN